MWIIYDVCPQVMTGTHTKVVVLFKACQEAFPLWVATDRVTSCRRRQLALGAQDLKAMSLKVNHKIKKEVTFADNLSMYRKLVIVRCR